MEDLSDEYIVKQVQEGNTEAFGTLIERYENRIRRYAERFLADKDDAKDVAQNAFMKGYENLQAFDVSRRFSPWIYRIAHNEIVNVLKRRSRMIPIAPFEFDILFPHFVMHDPPENDLDNRALTALVETHVHELDRKYREPLLLYYVENMSYQDIADVLTIPIATVGVRLNRGKKIIREKIKSNIL